MKGFKSDVYDDSSMAKENVSARVPPSIADGIERYAELYDLTRTEAMTALLGRALEDPPHGHEIEASSRFGEHKPVYTVALAPENGESIEESDLSPSEFIDRCIRTVHFHGLAP